MSTQNSLDLIGSFLSEIRDRHDKEAADNSVSFKDTAAAKPEEQAKQQAGATEQKTLGKEQKQDAHDGGANADSVEPNSEADGKDYADTAGINTLDTDDKVVDKGNLGPMRAQAVTQEQKMARADRLAETILTVIERNLPKEAAGHCSSCGKDDCECPEAEGEHGDDYANNMMTDEEKEAAATYQKFASVAQEAAQDYFEGFLLGMLKRAQDEADLRAANLPPEVLEKVGGIEGLLDKVAMEDPMAVLPEEAMAAEAPVEEAPMEGGGEDLDALTGELEAAGVSEADLEAAMADIAALQEAGVAPEEIAQALSELEGEGGGEEAPMPAEGELKEASAVQRQRVDAVKAFLSR